MEGWNIKSFLYVNENNLSDWAKGIISSTSTEINFILTELLMKELSGKKDTSEIMTIVSMRTDNLDALVLSNNQVIALFDKPSNKVLKKII